ncbi:MAG: hypothetical protein R6U36_07800 [Candidatus Fermentibacteraceae bacterium]
MRRAFATLMLLLAGCGGGLTGHLGEDLSIAAIEVRTDSTATLHASLSDAGLLPELLGLLEGLDIRGVTVRARMDRELAEAFDEATYWLEVEPAAEGASAALLHIDLYGLSWSPAYTWSNGQSAEMTAEVLISNATGHILEADTVLVLDRDGTVLAKALGATIPRGERAFPWWTTGGTVHGPVVRFGWPLPDRARAMMAFLPDRPGPVTGTESREGILPVYSSDTLWLPADDVLDVRQYVEQLPAGYAYAIHMTNISDSPMSAGIRIPHSLPRGAGLAGPVPPKTVILAPGQSDSITFTYVYPQ